MSTIYEELQVVSTEIFQEFGTAAVLYSHDEDKDEQFEKGNVVVVAMSDAQATKAGFSMGDHRRAFYISHTSKHRPEPGDWIDLKGLKYTFSEVLDGTYNGTTMYYMGVGR